MDNTQPLRIEQLLASWPPDQPELLTVFNHLSSTAREMPGVKSELVSRPGVSHSFRAALEFPKPGRNRPVFLLIDVVVSQSEPWFLSVCFYADEITDPEELGNPIPKGLYEETGYCFDVETLDEQMDYLIERMKEAHAAAGG